MSKEVIGFNFFLHSLLKFKYLNQVVTGNNESSGHLSPNSKETTKKSNSSDAAQNIVLGCNRLSLDAYKVRIAVKELSPVIKV